MSATGVFALEISGSFLILGWPVWAALAIAIATGFAFGSINGLLIGYLRLRAFLTTLVTLIIGRALFDILVVDFAAQIQLSTVQSDTWDFIGDGTVFGFSLSVIAAAIIAIIAHVALTRSRPGWQRHDFNFDRDVHGSCTPFGAAWEDAPQQGSLLWEVSRRIRGHRSHDRSLAAYSISRSDTNARAGHITLAKHGLERTGERMRLCLFQVTSRNAPRG